MAKAQSKTKAPCVHPETARVDGGYDGATLARYPLRYGSAQVAECGDCGAWHMPVHAPLRWHPGPYAKALKKQIEIGDDN